MSPTNALIATNREEFRQWLADNHDTATECWLRVKCGRPVDDGTFCYLDSVEEALCFGWVDGHLKAFEGLGTLQRFTPRAKRSPWTELNKECVRRLETLGLMTDSGRAVLPPMGPRSFRIDADVEGTLKDARVWAKHKLFPPLYQRIRAYNVAFLKGRPTGAYEKSPSNFIEYTRRGEMYGEWNDCGRLLGY